MDLPPDLNVESLRRIARALLYDDALAMDAAQDTWLAAVGESPSGAPSESRSSAWFGGVVRRIAQSMRRDASRRREREVRAARPEGLPSTVDVLAQVELLRRLIDAVARLDEPYRTAIALRYFDDLPPRAIAQRLGVPVNTVKTRLQRGLQSLRRDLLERDRDQLAGLTVIAGGTGLGTLAGEVGALLMGKKVVAIAAAIICLVALFVTGRGFGWVGPRDDPSASLVPVASFAASSGQIASIASDTNAADQRAPVVATAAPKSWTVSGHVVLDGRMDLADAPLLGRWLDGPYDDATVVREWRIRSDARGDFTWTIDAPPGPFYLSLVAEIPGATSHRLADAFMPTDEQPTDWIVHAFSKDCTLRGSVRDRDGEPVVGARVSLRPDAECVVTDARGRFALPASSENSDANLRIVADGFRVYAHRQGRLAPGDNSVPDIVLEHELVLRGRVLDETGAALSGARVAAAYPFDGRDDSITSAAGVFEVGGIDPDAKVVHLNTRCAGYVVKQFRVDPPAFGSTEIELRMSKGARVSGRVLLPDGAPAHGVLVRATEDTYNAPPREASGWTDEEGRFTLPGVEHGARSLWIQRSGYVARRHRIEVPDDFPALEGVELRLERGRELVGRVTRTDGTPVPWAIIAASEVGSSDRAMSLETNTLTDRAGRFRFAALADATLFVSAFKPRFTRAMCTRRPTDVGALELHMDPGASLAGRVVDAASATPVREFRVRVRASRSADPNLIGLPAAWMRYMDFESEDGTWRLDSHLESGKLTCVDIEADGYAPARIDPLATSLDPDPAAMTIALAARTLVSGSVELATDGAPIVGARIRAYWHASELRSTEIAQNCVATTDSRGRFELVDLPSGPTWLSIEPAGGVASVDGPFDVHPNATTPRRIRLGSIEGASLRGKLLDASGAGIGGEKVVARALDGSSRIRLSDATTEADGSYAIRGLEGGDYHVSWQRISGTAQANDLLELVHVDAHRTVEHDLRPIGHAHITGRVECDNALPNEVVVQLAALPDGPTYADGRRQWAPLGRATFATGSAFEFANVPPGRYSARAWCQLADGTEITGSSEAFDVTNADTRLDCVIQARVP